MFWSPTPHTGLTNNQCAYVPFQTKCFLDSNSTLTLVGTCTLLTIVKFVCCCVPVYPKVVQSLMTNFCLVHIIFRTSLPCCSKFQLHHVDLPFQRQNKVSSSTWTCTFIVQPLQQTTKQKSTPSVMIHCQQPLAVPSPRLLAADVQEVPSSRAKNSPHTRRFFSIKF